MVALLFAVTTKLSLRRSIEAFSDSVALPKGNYIFLLLSFY